MSDYTTGKGVYKGWHWRNIGLTVIGVTILQVVSFYTIRLPILQSTQIAMFLTIWLIISRLHERRLANGLIGMMIVFIIGFVLQFTIDPATKRLPLHSVLQTNLMVLSVSALLAIILTKMQGWSERKRATLEAKRKQKMSASKPEYKPAVRVHRKKRRRK